METNELLAKGYFNDEYTMLEAFLKLPTYNLSNYAKENIKVDILSKTKEEFLLEYNFFSDSEYDRFKEFVSFFEKRNFLTYKAFADLLFENYGQYIQATKDINAIEFGKNIKVIKNIMIFFAIIVIVSNIVVLILFAQ